MHKIILLLIATIMTSSMAEAAAGAGALPILPAASNTVPAGLTVTYSKHGMSITGAPIPSTAAAGAGAGRAPAEISRRAYAAKAGTISVSATQEDVTKHIGPKFWKAISDPREFKIRGAAEELKMHEERNNRRHDPVDKLAVEYFLEPARELIGEFVAAAKIPSGAVDVPIKYTKV